MTANALVDRVKNECVSGPFNEKWITQMGTRISCTFGGFDVMCNDKVIHLTLDVYCEKIKEQYISLSIRFGGGIDKRKVLKALEPILREEGFVLGRLSPRSHERLMLTGLALSADQLVAKVNNVTDVLSKERSNIERIIGGLNL